jgi:tRNA A-37 threonylcarbamoyl transferase component Bud32
VDKDPPRAGSDETTSTVPDGEPSRPTPTRLATGTSSTLERAATTPAEPPDEAVRLVLPRTLTPLPTSTVRFMLALQGGSPVGEYVIQDQIGEGAMGTVYSAIQPLIGKTVAIKVLKPELCMNQVTIDRFINEAQAVNRIGHPNIVDVFSLGELPDGRAYMVMEWLRGEDLKARLTRGPLSVADACDILDGIARALDAAHAKDIVHRDLKPDNVFLHQIESGPVMVKLLDFGIAKLMRAQKMEKTATGNMLGTPRYISPEQARGIDVTHRSDIYSLGVMAYEMLAGRPPFQGETAMDLVIKHLSESPPPLSQFTRVPRALEHCVMRMIEKDPAQRPTLTEVRQILVDPTRKLARPPLLRRAPLIAGGVVLAGVAGFVAWKLATGGRDTAEVAAPAPIAKVEPPPVAAAVDHKPDKKVDEIEAPVTAPRRGTLEVRLDKPDGAIVLVDNHEWRGKQEIEEGEHDVEVRANGGSRKRRVKIGAGESQVVMMDVPAPVARPPVNVAAKRPPPPPPVKKPPPPPPTTKLDENVILRPK